MDPLSITSASVALAAAVFKCAIHVKHIVGTIADAPDTLSDLAEEAQLIQGVLQGVEDALRDNQEAISRCKVDDVFSIAVKGCRATLACIKQEFELLFNRSDWKSRFMVLWKEDDMKRLLGRLDRKRESILLLLQLLNLSSMRQVRALVAKKQGALTVAKEDITALIPTYWSCRDTILDSLDKETVDSIYADWENRDSLLSTTEFDFDYELINTRAYRRALTQAQTRKPRQLPPRRESDHSTLLLNNKTMEPVEDLIDLTCEPSRNTILIPSRMPSQSYKDLAGLQFMSMTAHEADAVAGNFDILDTAEPIETDKQCMDGSSLELERHEIPSAKSDKSRELTAHNVENYRRKGARARTPTGSKMAMATGAATQGSRQSQQNVIQDAVTERRQEETKQRVPIPNELPETLSLSSYSISTGPPPLPLAAELSDVRRCRKHSTHSSQAKYKLADSVYQPSGSENIPDANRRPRTKRRADISRPGQHDRPKSTRSTKANPESRSNINNPKLLETVEDAIRRLILPELEAVKREKAQRERRTRDNRFS
ncbi:hypothetical protein FIE12Z_4895 [Fusarium flagelliforme]|uniref:Fungal N-terminal domain-containing protein n=1 Tax=Fusarium flagelliforme TaxID=2675880 RepID=A0A395MUE9_9HYPO|nr:hypothetical protein FIE12Z_4895 [Fusarium flagelliforme]